MCISKDFQIVFSAKLQVCFAVEMNSMRASGHSKMERVDTRHHRG
jgi:hypothetical protein